MIKKTLLRSIILLPFILLFVNCSKDDDSPDSPDLSANTFLERFDNTNWVSVLEDGDYTPHYERFHNTLSNPVESWEHMNGDCYDDGFIEGVEVIENSRNTLIISFKSGQVIWTYTAVGEKIEWKSSYNGDTGGPVLYEKTTSSVIDGLTFCD